MIYLRIRDPLLLLVFFLFSALLQSNTVLGKMPPTQLPYSINNIRYYPIFSVKNFQQRGIASWYGPGFHGKMTSNGERYDMYAMTAAHKTLPMNTLLRVKNLDNGREVIVRVNDRGPFIQKRILDLSYAAAQNLGILQPGTARVEINAINAANTSEKGQAEKRTAFTTSKQKKEYYVQIGAFSQYDNALRLQQYFSAAGHKTIIQSSANKKKGKPLHLVQVYVGNMYQQAQKAEQALIKKGYNGAFLLRRQ